MRALALMTMLLPAAAMADGRMAVPLPDLSGLSAPQAEALLAALVQAVVIGQNCEGFLSTDGEWSLLNDSADILADDVLGLSVDDYDSRFWNPAFALLDDPAACGREGPKVEGLLRLLEDLGGSRIPTGPWKG